MRRGCSNSHTLLFWFSIFIKSEMQSCEINSLFLHLQSNISALNKVGFCSFSLYAHIALSQFCSRDLSTSVFLGFVFRRVALIQLKVVHSIKKKLKSHVSEKLQSTEVEIQAVRYMFSVNCLIFKMKQWNFKKLVIFSIKHYLSNRPGVPSAKEQSFCGCPAKAQKLFGCLDYTQHKHSNSQTHQWLHFK